jgi:hypothetical protein
MDWARILAYVTGTMGQELLARNEYLAAENRILKAQLEGQLKLSDAERATLAPTFQSQREDGPPPDCPGITDPDPAHGQRQPPLAANASASRDDANTAPSPVSPMSKDVRQSSNHRHARSQKRRSASLRRGCGFRRCRTNSCCRRQRLSAINSTFGRTAAAIVHSKHRNIHLSRLLSDRQEVDRQCRQ